MCSVFSVTKDAWCLVYGVALLSCTYKCKKHFVNVIYATFSVAFNFKNILCSKIYLASLKFLWNTQNIFHLPSFEIRRSLKGFVLSSFVIFHKTSSFNLPICICFDIGVRCLKIKNKWNFRLLHFSIKFSKIIIFTISHELFELMICADDAYALFLLCIYY